MKLTMPRATSHIKPTSKVEIRKREPDLEVERGQGTSQLEPTGQRDEMDFSQIYSKKNVADDEDVPELETWDE